MCLTLPAVVRRSHPDPGHRPRCRGASGAWRAAAALTLLLAFAALLALPARAQERRAILWLIETAPDAAITREVVADLFGDLLSSATDSQHLVDVQGLAEALQRDGMPIPGCLAGTAPCPDLPQAVAQALRLDILATVRVYDEGNRMTLTISQVGSPASHLLEFTGAGVRDTAFRLVNDFLGATGTLVVQSIPAEATVFLDDRQIGLTPLRLQVPVGIYPVRVELEGYHGYQQTLEIRPEEIRSVDTELQREYAQLLVQTITPQAVLLVDGQPIADMTRPIRLQPGVHTIRLEAVDCTPDERLVDLLPGTDTHLRIDLSESPQARRRRLMGYVYERPFYVQGGFHYTGSESGFSGSSGSIGERSYTIRCPGSDDGSCSSFFLPLDSLGAEVNLGYSSRYFEIGLLSLVLAYAGTGGSEPEGGRVIMAPSASGSGDEQVVVGEVSGVTRVEVQFLHPGARLLINELWSLYLQGGFGRAWELFDATDPTGQSGGFTRSGWIWSVDAGLRLYLNDALFLRASFVIGDDLSHDDSDLFLGANLGMGITWEDIFGLNRLFGGGPGETDDLAATSLPGHGGPEVF
ncbi:MAG: PEGA domain-containing protein [Bradymonadales bacterium]|nr:PEGA domain-containing protein [Bradymonadales bacterium]